MSLRVRRGGTAASLAVAVAVVLTATGCAAGFDAPTNEPYTPTNGADGRVGDMKVRAVLVVTDGTQPTELNAVLVNIGTDADVLTQVEVDGAAAVTLPSATVPVPVQTAVALGGESDQRVTLSGSTLAAGQLTTVRFAFRDNGILELDGVLVQDADDVTAGS